MTKQTITIIIIALLSFGLGYFLAASDRNEFQAGWDAANQRLTEIGYLEPESEEGAEIKTISGEVAGIEGDKISLKINRPLDPLADPELDIRIVRIDNETKIVLRIVRDEEELMKEMEEFENKMAELEEREEESEQWPSEPKSFIIKEGSLSDIKIGQRISVVAGENIKAVKEFTALELTVQ